MTSYETYILILCLIVFVLLTTLSVVCVTVITRLTLRTIRLGGEDEQLVREAEKVKKKRAKVLGIIENVFSTLVCLVFITAFGLALYTRCTEEQFHENIPTYRVVLTGSMAEAHKDNAYLRENGLTNQLQVFDLAAFYRVPPQEELQLYDVIVYEHEGDLICHRIVDIFQNGTVKYITQGDALAKPDYQAVTYDQIRAIYRGEKIPFVGSFIMFLRSPAGWLCMLLVLVGMIAAPLVDRKLEQERKLRLQQIRAVAQAEAVVAQAGEEVRHD